jgi:hypothetical protein
MTYPSPRRNNSNQTPIYVGQRVIGVVAGATFKKTISGSKHILRRPRAIAFEGKQVRVARFHRLLCLRMGFQFVEAHAVTTPRQRHGQNGDKRVTNEWVFVFELVAR